LVCGFVVVGAACTGWWLVPELVFQYRFGAVLPAGVSKTTNVISMSWPSPPDVTKTYSRHIREFFGCYYPELQMRFSRRWWDQFPKRVDDVLDEYGAEVRDGQLVDASGRNICIMKKLRGGWSWDAQRGEWEDRRHKLLAEHCTVLVVDIEEDE